jgi:hypothetical protein
MEEIESSINRYLTALDAADQEEPKSPQPKVVRLEERIAKLKAQMKELQAIEIQLNESPDKQVSLTDPDARSMMTRGTGIVGYNVQTAVDTQHTFDRCSRGHQRRFRPRSAQRNGQTGTGGNGIRNAVGCS